MAGLAAANGAAPTYPARGRASAATLALVLVGLGLAVLYVPMLVEFGGKIWWDEDNGHAGLLLLCLIGVFWYDRGAWTRPAGPAEFATGATGVVVALAGCALGRVTGMVQLQGLSMPLLGLGLTLAAGGRPLLARWALLCVLLAFTVPWLGPFADWLLVPLRLQVTSAAVALLGAFGLPVSATGVLVNVGFVQLNVAGACVGLRSTISIFALGLLSLHLFPPRSLAAGALFVALLPLIGLGANFLRVCLLIGSAAHAGVGGVTRMHDIAAYLEVIVSLGLFLLLSATLSGRRPPA